MEHILNTLNECSVFFSQGSEGVGDVQNVGYLIAAYGIFLGLQKIGQSHS